MVYTTDHLGNKTSFTLCQDYKIHQLYLAVPIRTLAGIIKKSAYGTKNRIDKLGLVIPKELAEKRKINSRIKKGNIPFNKGLKQTEFMSAKAIEKSKKTRFKKGNIPHCTLPVGAEIEILDNYIKVKVAMPNKWMLKHHIIYLKEHPNQKIKPNENIVFIDGNRSNFHPTNLKKVTDTELMEMNSMAKLSPEWKRIIRLKNKIKNQLNP